MLKLLAIRAVAIIPLLLIVSFIAFGLNQINPVDPAELLLGSQEATQEQIDAVREQLGLNDPFLVRYFDWLGGASRATWATTSTPRSRSRRPSAPGHRSRWR